MSFEQIKKEALDNRIPIVRDDTLSYMIKVINNNGYKHILELGSAVGYSSIAIALSNEDIYIDTLEKNEILYNKAIENIKSVGLENRINIINKPIELFTPNHKYDFIFIDAAKSQYDNYFQRFIDYLDNNGKMLFDNMIFHGMIDNINEIKNRNTRSLVKKIRNFRKKMLKITGFDIIINDTIGDGYMLVSRRQNGL